MNLVIIFIIIFDILSNFIKKINSKTYIYYDCSKKRNGCKGYVKYNKLEKYIIFLTNVIVK
jgi:hypothetical protein